MIRWTDQSNLCSSSSSSSTCSAIDQTHLYRWTGPDGVPEVDKSDDVTEDGPTFAAKFKELASLAVRLGGRKEVNNLKLISAAVLHRQSARGRFILHCSTLHITPLSPTSERQYLPQDTHAPPVTLLTHAYPMARRPLRCGRSSRPSFASRSACMGS